MSYEADVMSAERCEKLRVLFIVIAVGLLVVSIVLDISWMHWPRALAWGAAGLAGIYEGRALKRLGRDPDASYLRGALCLIVGVLCVV